ncbi:transferase [Salipaludibacillus neizhouensis]|uniref:Transferase n=1 Tax=Salipaludibacillus neizhouensis TaxID=885475 RepID=A0A3A9KA71_9BACI|nr:acetyltransferase [Salipaludibacillus neizhouensis]RKL69099.1 transferase [Salipaludibacillus neizhouensis]
MIGIIGSGGHAKVILDIFLKSLPFEQITFFSSNPSVQTFEGFPLYTDSIENHHLIDSKIDTWHIAIGDQNIRKEKITFLLNKNFFMTSAIHHKSIISESSKIGNGTSIMAGAVVNPQTTIGKGCVINTSASVDHDCKIDDYVNVGPGSILTGNVYIGKLTDIGAGVTIIPNIKIGKNCRIGAGAVVISNIPDNSVCVGVPAKVIRTNKPL